MTRVLIVNDKPKHERELASLRSVDVLDNEIKRTEADLRVSEERYRDLVESTHDLIQSVAPDGHFLFANRVWLKTLGYTQQELQHLKITDVITTESLAHCQQLFARVMAGKPVTGVEAEFLTKDGRKIFVEGSASPLLRDGRVIATHGFFRDVTERKLVEKELGRSEEVYRTLVEQAPDAIFIANSDLRFIDVNARACELSGYAHDEILRMSIPDFMPPEDILSTPLRINELGQGKTVITERQFIRKNGSLVPVEVSSRFLSDGRLQAIVRDITRRKKDDALLYGQKRVLELVATGAPLSETLTALIRVIETQSPEMLCTVLLLDADGVHLRHGAAPSLPVEYTRAIDGLAIGPSVGSCGTAAFGREPVIVEDIATDPLWEDYRSLALPVGLRSCWSAPIFDAQRRVLGTFAIYYRRPGRPTEQHLRLIDIATQTAAIAIGRERTQAALLQSESRHRRLVESNIIGVMIANTDGSIKEANDLFLRRVGYTRPDLEAGLVRWDMLTPPEWSDLDEYIIAQLESTGACPPVAKEYFHKDGHRVPILITVALLEGEPGDCICLIEDMTESKLAEAALLDSNDRFRIVARATNDAVWDWNLVTSALWWNEGYHSLFGYSLEETSPDLDSWSKFIHADDVDHVLHGIHEAIDQGGQAWSDEYRFQRRDGTYAEIFDRGHIIRDAGGKAVRMIGAMQDITERVRAEDALKETEERFSTIFKAAPGSMMLFSLPDSKTVEVNDQFTQITGYTREEAIGKNSGEMGMWADPKARERFLELIEKDGAVSNFEADLKHRSGAIRNGLASGHLITIRDKKYLLGVFFDITERKQAERERDRLFESERYARQVTETMSAANLALTQDLVLNTVLDTLLDFLSQLIPFDSANVMLLEDDTRLLVRTARGYEGFTDPAQTQAVKFDIRHSSVFRPILDGKQSLVIPDTRDFAGWERPTGAEHVISWMGVPLMAGGKIIGLYSMDKTTAGFFTEEHRQLAESLAGQAAVAIQNALLIEEVRQYAAELELRVFQRTAQLSAANKELESFSYSVSHDLRAPLRAVSGFAEIIARRHRASLNEEGQHYFDNIVKASGRMGNLIDDLLTYSRLGRSGVRSEPVALAGLIGEIGGYLQSRVEEIHGTFKIVDGLPAVMGDHTLLSQLFTNLLENGITYKKLNVPPHVEVAYQLEGENVIVTVSDNGIGIPEEYYEKIFDIFQRLHTDEEYPGTGIGLATVKKAVELLGGSIWVESVVGKGSTFRVRLRRSDV